jgi:hypothetical protein
MSLRSFFVRSLLIFLLCCHSLSSFAAPNPNPPCSPDWTPPIDTGGTGVQALLKGIPLATKWADLPPATKTQLQTHADNRLAAFRARWGAEVLRQKETILQGCATPEMVAAIDDYYRKSYDTVLPTAFSLKDVKSAAFARALIRSYLGALAAYRASLTYPSGKLPNRDWDGKSFFDSIRLPDQQTYEDIKAYNASVVADLRAVDDATLDDTERVLKQNVLFGSRARSVGGFSGDSFGGSDMEVVCELIGLNNDVVHGFKADGRRPRIFASDDEVLREVNASYLHSTRLKWLDLGTLASMNHPLCRGTDDDLKQYVGDPATEEVAKGIVLLRSWWIERVSVGAEAQNKCTIYSTQDRAQIWEAFSADQQSNNDEMSSMATYNGQLGRYRADKIVKYRDAARLALQQVFPNNAVLTAPQRQQVHAMIDAEVAFGLLVPKIATTLDAVQGTTNGVATVAWNKAVATHLATIGGHYAEDEVTIKKMFEEVKAWVGARYVGYPIDVASQFSKFKFTVNNSGGAETSTSTGDIKFGVGTERSKMEYYSILLHELRHAVAYAWRATAPDKSKVASDTGTAIEGSGVAVEELVLAQFLRETLKDDLSYALYSVDYGIRDARFAGTTDATLQKYFRSDCSGVGELNTIDFTKKIADSYGLTGDKADTLALRAHIGTQYFQYISAGVQIVDDIKYLQQQIDPSGKNQIDPFGLFACGLNTPRRDERYVAALKACMKL